MRESCRYRIYEVGDIKQAMKIAADELCSKSEELDFAIIEIRTFAKDELGIENDAEIKTRDIGQYISKGRFQLYQRYTIDFYESPRKPEYTKISISSNAKATEVFAFANEQNLQYNIEVKKALALNGFLIGVFEESIRGITSLKNKKRVLRSTATPIEPKDATIFWTILRKNNVNKTVIPVSKGEQIVRIRKHKVGAVGRSCRGLIIDVNEPIQTNDVYKFDYSKETIARRESESFFDFFALNEGFVDISARTLEVKKTLVVRTGLSVWKIGNLDFQNLASIVIRPDSKLELESNSINDQVSLRAKNITVSGSLGTNVSLEAERIIVKGVVHKDSSLKSQDCSISILKGSLVNKNLANIKHLEQHSQVQTKRLEATDALGSRISTHSTIINKLMDENDVTAIESIIIKSVEGLNNKLKVRRQKSLIGDSFIRIDNIKKGCNVDISFITGETELKGIITEPGVYRIDDINTKESK